MIMTRLGNVIYDQPTTLEPYVLLEITSTTMAAILNPTLGFFPAFFYPSSFSQAWCHEFGSRHLGFGFHISIELYVSGQFLADLMTAVLCLLSEWLVGWLAGWQPSRRYQGTRIILLKCYEQSLSWCLAYNYGQAGQNVTAAALIPYVRPSVRPSIRLFISEFGVSGISVRLSASQPACPTIHVGLSVSPSTVI